MQRKWHYIDETARREWQNPEAILQSSGLKSGHILADIGCGNGFFTIPAARIVGPKGKVYGVDVSAEAIDDLRRQAVEEGLTNLDLIVAKAEETVICSGCLDIAFFGIVLHDFQNPAKVLKNARKMLKPGGKLVKLDWKKIAMPFGPPLSIRFDEATAVGLIEPAGFKVETIDRTGKYHYVIIAEPV